MVISEGEGNGLSYLLAQPGEEGLAVGKVNPAVLDMAGSYRE